MSLLLVILPLWKYPGVANERLAGVELPAAPVLRLNIENGAVSVFMKDERLGSCCCVIGDRKWDGAGDWLVKIFTSRDFFPGLAKIDKYRRRF